MHYMRALCVLWWAGLTHDGVQLQVQSQRPLFVGEAVGSREGVHWCLEVLCVIENSRSTLYAPTVAMAGHPKALQRQESGTAIVSCGFLAMMKVIGDSRCLCLAVRQIDTISA